MMEFYHQDEEIKNDLLIKMISKILEWISKWPSAAKGDSFGNE